MKLKNLIMTAGLLALGSEAFALEIVVNNTTQSEASFAFSYLDSTQSKWLVEGWYNVGPGSQETIVLNTDNALYYLYAELGNGRKIEAAPGQGARLAVFDGSFIYDQEKLGSSEDDKKVGFVRAQSSENNKAVINLN